MVMKTHQEEALASGVFVEFHDRAGNTIGQALYADWQGRPVPAVGDMWRCPAQRLATGRREQLTGRVLSRHFEVQYDGGQPCVWVRLILVVAPAPVAPAFSTN
jgi:hypothetical protein